jgi:hypothetical protein
MAKLKTAEARIGQRGKTAFFGEPDAFLPGQGTRVPFLQCGEKFYHKTNDLPPPKGNVNIFP